jgi:hypothetical protein
MKRTKKGLIASCVVVGSVISLLLIGYAAQEPPPSTKEDPTSKLVTTGETHQEKVQEAKYFAACPQADDPKYGRSVSSAIQIGGGVMGGPERQVKFLKILCGPAGEGIEFKRLGSEMNADMNFIDVYEIKYKGLVEPDHLYFDEYTWAPLKIPTGYKCTSAIPYKKK